MNTEELKPCPFCGGKAEIFDNHTDFMADHKRYFIRCKNSRCAMIIAFGVNTRKDQTIKAFNNRAKYD